MTSEEKRPVPYPLQMLHFLPFFVLTAIYIWLFVEPRLIFHGFGSILPGTPPFLTGARFLKDTLSLPGGFVMYLSGFLSQGFASSGLGAVIIASVGFCLHGLSIRHLNAAKPTFAALTATLGPIALFLIYSRYEHPLTESLTVCLGLLVSFVFEKLPLRNSWLRLAVYGIFAAIAYWLIGAGGLLVFSSVTFLHGVLVHRKVWFSTLLLAVGVAILWLASQILFLIPPQQAFLGLTPFSASVTERMKPVSRALVILVYVCVPISMTCLFLADKLTRRVFSKHRVKSRHSKKNKAAGTPRSKWCFPAILKQLTYQSVPFILMGTGLYTCSNAMSKPFVQAHDYARHKQWNKILDLSRTLPKGQGNVFVSHNIIRSLYHTGRLPYDLFQFPLTPHGLLLTHEKTESFLTQLTLSDLFMELGQVNMAEKLASEFLAVNGLNGPVLEQLAWINIYKGKTETARIFLNALKKDIIYRHAANSLLDGLDHGFESSQLTRIKRVQSYMCQDPGEVASIASAETILLSALQFNPKNKMAFEYLMACYLLTGQLDDVLAHVNRVKDLGYEGIPTLYEEAILIHTGINGRNLDLTRFKVRQATIQRYMRFTQLRNSMTARNQTSVLNRLIKEFGQSYLFYFAFGRVGLV